MHATLTSLSNSGVCRRMDSRPTIRRQLAVPPFHRSTVPPFHRVYQLPFLSHRSRRQPPSSDLSGRAAARVRRQEGQTVGDLYALRPLESHTARGTLGGDRRIRATV